MKRIKIIAVLLLILGMSANVSGQDSPAIFNLKSSIEYGLKNHPSSTVYTNEAEIARYKNKEGLSGYLPQINASGSVDYNAKLQTSVIPAGIFGPNETHIQMGNKHVNGIVVQMDQKIYDQSTLITMKGMRNNQELANLKILKNNEDLVYQTAAAYYQVLILNEQEKLLKENEKQYNDLVKIMKLQYDNGVIKKIDYDRTRVGLNNIVSQLNLTQTNKKLALNKLKIAIGMPMEEPLEIEQTLNYDQQIVMPVETTYDVSNRLDFKIQDQNIQLLEIQMKSKKAAFLPTLSGYARYGQNAFGAQFGPSFNHWFDYSAVGLKVNVPIMTGFRTYSQFKISQLTLDNQKETAKLNVQNFKLENENAHTKLVGSYTSLNTNKENLELAKSVYEASSLEYKEGKSSLVDFLNSEYAYKEAQSNYINSLLAFLSSRLDYEKAKGTLTTYISQL